MKKNILIIMAFVVVGGISALSVFAVDQVKTTDTLIFSSDVAVTGVTNTAFTLYIGDNLTGVTTPMQSLYFVTSGVYTGNGSFSLSIDSDAATTQSFTLPTVGTVPTPFEFIYKDPSNKISPTSAGNYAYTLNMTPSGVIVYGLGVKMSETHRFAPPTCADGVPANEKVKTTDTLVFSSDTAVTVLTNATVNLYIGDNLAGITTPMKSLYFVVSGVYTGNGSFSLSIDSDAATTQSFTLPTVGTVPTPFEFIYKDPSNKISPTSAGNYAYTLNMTPSGVIVYGLGVKMSETHRYKPPSCGTGLSATGELASAVLDSTVVDGAGYNSIMWNGTEEGTGKVQFQLATSNSSSGPWSYYGGSTCGALDWYDTDVSGNGGGPGKPVELLCAPSKHNNQRYYRYKIQICSNTDCLTSGTASPVVNEVVVNLAP